MGRAEAVAGGALGRVLDVDLSTGRWDTWTLPAADRVALLGGKALAAKLLLERLPAGTDPLSPENLLVVNVGLLTGSGAPCSSRFNLSTRSPLTGAIVSSNCGGTFGMHLRWAGYEVLLLRGRAAAPVWLELRDDELRFHDASPLWGLDTEATQAALPRFVGSLVIGPAGENLVRYACILSGHRVLGRAGVGAVFGSKNLKAICASGTRRVPVARPAAFERAVRDWADTLRAHPITGAQLPRYGTAGLASTTNATRTLPVRNFQQGHVADLGTASGEAMAETILERNSQCRSCPIRCARVVRLDDRVVKGPEFETLGMFGPSQGTFDIEAIARLGRECDLLGLDTITAGSTLACAMELRQRGHLDLDLDWGQPERVLPWLGAIARREPGLADELAEGSLRFATRYGAPELAMQSKGLEFASYEPRHSVGLGLGYAVSNRGGCHLAAGYLVFFEALGPLQVDPTEPKGKPALVVFQQNVMDAVSACGNCVFTTYAVVPGGLERVMSLHGRLAGLASHALLGARALLDHQSRLPPWALPFHLPLIPQTRVLSELLGQRVGLGEFLAAGERGHTLERLFNLREGFGAADDALPPRMTDEPEQPARPETVVPLAEMLPVYYRARHWDAQGVPQPGLLRRLGLAAFEPLRSSLGPEAERRAARFERQRAAEARDRDRYCAARAQSERLAAERPEAARRVQHAERSQRALEVRGARFECLPERCVGCGLCHGACPAAAIAWEPGSKAQVLQDACVHCGRCEEACPPRFAAVRRTAPGPGPAPPIHRIDPALCRKCGLCYRACPVDAIRWQRRELAVIDEALCVRCGRCFAACPSKWAAVQRIEEP